MKHVYILRSVAEAERHYVGQTGNLRERLKKHNSGQVRHTAKYPPWILKTYIAFSNDEQAISFERYLKTASGRAFAGKRL